MFCFLTRPVAKVWMSFKNAVQALDFVDVPLKKR